MKRILLFITCALALTLTACTGSRDYNCIYLREVLVDDFDADEELFDEAAEALAASGLPVITRRSEARALTPNERLTTLKVTIDLRQKRRSVEADIDIENYSSNRELFDAEYRQPRGADDDDTVLSLAVQGVIDEALDWFRNR